MPDWKEEVATRLRPLRLAPAREAEIVEELSQHLEDRYKGLVTSGAAEEEARRVTLEELSDETLMARGLRGVEQEVNQEPIAPGGSGGDNFLASASNDARYGLRALAKNPGLAAVAVLTLALGIGANTAIFSMVNGIILRTLPYRAAGQLYAINEQIPQFISRSPWGPWFPVNPANFRLWQGQCPAMESMALIGPAIFNMTGEGEPRQVQGVKVSADFFSMMDARPQLGRTFLPEEDQLGRDNELILSAQFWRKVFNSDPHILGRSITLDNASYTVVGVMPENFRFPELPHLPISAPELFKPIGFQKWEFLPGLGGFNYAVIARLKPGASAQQALAQLNVVEARIAREGDPHRGVKPGEFDLKATLRPLKIVILGPAQQALWVLMVAAGFVLLIICVNLANLLLVRNAGRAREVAVRSALGATRSRLLRQFFAEGMILAAAGGGLGLLLAAGGLQLLVKNAPLSIPRLDQVQLDPGVLLFTTGVSIAAALLFALLPALRLGRVHIVEALKSAGPAASGSHESARLRGGLVVSQIALCGVLLTGALLMIESLRNVSRVNQWMDEEHVLTADLALPPGESHTTQQASEFLSRVLDKVGVLPGVRSAGFTSKLPLLGQSYGDDVDFREVPAPPGTHQLGDFRFVSPGYFGAVGLPLLKGRMLSENDRGKDLALISESVARKFLPGRDPIGVHLLWSDNGPPLPRVIVGEVADVRNASDEPPIPAVYLPLWTFYQTSETLVVRTAMEPAAVADSIRRAVWSVDPQVAISQERTLSTVVRSSEAARRYETFLGAIFASFAVLLAALGLYGVISYSVSRRTHEIGIRMALGARRSDVLKMVVRNGLMLVLAGIGGGIIGAIALTRLLSTLLFGVRPGDPATLALVGLVLLAVGLLATYAPARRATVVDPMVALRYE